MPVSLFKPSPFWVSLRPAFSVKFLVTLAIVAGVFEVVARLAPVIVAHTVHQPYLISQRPCEIDCAEFPGAITWASNERGTRGGLYHGQSLRIATFGSSTTACSLLNQQQTWPEQLKSALGSERTHVDNYARDGATYRETIQILNRLADRGPRYDLVLIMMHLSTRDARESGTGDEDAFHYWGQWTTDRATALVWPSLLRKRVSAQLLTEPRTLAVWKSLSDPFRTHEPETSKFLAIARSNRVLRNEGRVTLIDEDYRFTADEIEGVRSHTREMLNAASRSKARVYLVLQPIAFDEQEVAEVAEKWVSLYEATDQPDAYLSNRSIAWGFREINDMMHAEADALGVPVLDLDSELRPLLRQRGDLFDDKWHFAPSGAAIAGERLAAILREERPELSAHASSLVHLNSQLAESRPR